MYENLKQMYSLSKTLKFELVPQGNTLKYIKENGIIARDENRKESYSKVKKLIDEYHKYFIDKSLENLNLSYLNEYYKLYYSDKKLINNKDEFTLVQSKLRKEIVTCFKEQEDFKNLFDKQLITNNLPSYIKDVDKLQLIKEFDKFTTYFTGFNTNRRNMYSDEEKSTAISYRLINENLPIFIDNMKIFEKAIQLLDKECIIKLVNELSHILQVNNIEEMFTLDYFNETLTQRGIDVYNHVISGYDEKDSNKIQGLNEYINLYNQKPSNKEKLNKFKPLYKQILSDSLSLSFLMDKFESDNDVLSAILEFNNKIMSEVLSNDVIENNIENLIASLNEFNLDNIYVNTSTLTTISTNIFNDWRVINEAIYNYYDNTIGLNSKNKDTEKYLEQRQKFIKQNKCFSICFLDTCLSDFNTDYSNKISEYYIENVKKQSKNIIDAFSNIETLVNCTYPVNKNLISDEESIEKIKVYLDAVKSLQDLTYSLNVSNDISSKDVNFYTNFSRMYNTLSLIITIYNMTRNYVTKKPYSLEKFKLNFDCPTLLNGWDLNKEKDYMGTMLMYDDKYYLAILNNSYKNVLQKKFNETDIKNKDVYKKINYKLLPGPNKMLPKVIFAKSNKDLYKPSEELLDKYHRDMHKKGPNFDLNFCHQLIEYFKHCISLNEDWNAFDFKFSDTTSYKDISQFYREVESQGYNIDFRYLPKEYVDDLVREGKLYLFQIYNKDFSSYSKGKPNLHTLYFKMLFNEDNLDKNVYKLNGSAEIFFRRKSIFDEKITHPKNIVLNNKNENNIKKTSIFAYDLIKDKRFREDKFEFHFPITINFNNKGMNNINEQVNTLIKYRDDNYVIGIDRGERHLLYLVLINSKGEIVKQFSLNDIINEYNGQSYTIKYHDLLHKREKDRELSRESWKTIENIKELKEGYLSQVINKITDLLIEYNATIVLEDLNRGFIQNRIKFERQVYQKFEKMLIDKLNYLCKKNIPLNEDGSILNAYQLTNKFESFNKLGKQSGILFYIPAWNTSKIDPVTGFVNLLYLKYENVNKSKELISKFDSIIFNSKDNYFEFKLDYSNFTAKADGTKTDWTICSYGERIETIKEASSGKYIHKTVNITQCFIELFNEYNINYTSSNLKEMILNIENKEFYQRFIYLLRLVLQMRNSSSVEDYLISPVKDKKGNFYDSRICNETLPKDADANGAYNIARKGLWAIKQIKATEDSKLNKVNINITNKEWLQFVQDNDLG